MSIEIKTIQDQELDRVCDILNAVIYQMQQNGFTQWDETYPTRETFQEDIIQCHLFGAYQKQKLVGFVAINSIQNDEYNKVDFMFGDAYLVVHRLQIDPIYLRKQIASKLMLHAEKLARENGLCSIRLDTREDNIPALKLYEKLGYIRRGHVCFPGRQGYIFLCFEKEIL